MGQRRQQETRRQQQLDYLRRSTNNRALTNWLVWVERKDFMNQINHESSFTILEKPELSEYFFFIKKVHFM